MRSFLPLLLSLGVAASHCVADFQGSTHLVDLDQGPIRYGAEPSHGPVACLIARVESGEERLEWDERRGWLPSLAKALKVALSSQMLVFSKTSLQRDHIGPANPRAIFYGDDAYLGYVPGAPLIEISEVDARLGGVFYTLEQRKDGPPKFRRMDSCTECHASGRTMGVPGHLVRSIETDATGAVDLSTGIDPVDHRTPFTDRWGGWYVTGRHGTMTHRGNLPGGDYRRARTDPDYAGNRAGLGDLVAAGKYPAPGSDIAALMVFEHQARMHNFIARLNYMASQHLAAYGHVDYLRTPVETFVKYALFAEEPALPAPLASDPAFVRDFEAAGPRDARGRSLRALDLKRRLFRYPCSFLLHSASFAALPAPLRQKILVRMLEVLTGRETSADYAALSAEDRTAVREILADTLPGLPAGWAAAAGR